MVVIRFSAWENPTLHLVKGVIHYKMNWNELYEGDIFINFLFCVLVVTLLNNVKVMARAPEDVDTDFDYLFKIILIGDPGVGKTAIVHRFKYNTFVERHASTIGVDFTLKTMQVDDKRIKVNKYILLFKYFHY